MQTFDIVIKSVRDGQVTGVVDREGRMGTFRAPGKIGDQALDAYMGGGIATVTVHDGEIVELVAKR